MKEMLYCRAYVPAMNELGMSVDGPRPNYQTMVTNEEAPLPRLIRANKGEGKIPMREIRSDQSVISKDITLKSRNVMRSFQEEGVFCPNDTSLVSDVWEDSLGEIMHYHLHMNPEISRTELDNLKESWKMDGVDVRRYIQKNIPKLDLSSHGIKVFLGEHGIVESEADSFENVSLVIPSAHSNVRPFNFEDEGKKWVGLSFEDESHGFLYNIGFGLESFDFEAIDLASRRVLGDKRRSLEEIRQHVDISVFADV